MAEIPKHAILQRDKRTYALVPRMPYGIMTPDNLETIARIARKHEVPVIKITSGQRIALVGIEPEKVADAWIDLGMQVGPAQELCVHYVQACPGTDWCRYGQTDSLGLGGRLEQTFVGRDMPAKVKLGISGCQFNCAEGWVRDFGAFGKKKGWTVMVGGNSGRKPRIGDLLVENVSEDTVVELAGKFLGYYAENGNRKERIAKFVARVGIDAIKEAIL